MRSVTHKEQVGQMAHLILRPQNSATTTALLAKALAGDQKAAQILRDMPDQATPAFKKRLRIEALRDTVGWLRAHGIQLSAWAMSRALAAMVSGTRSADLDHRLSPTELQELSLYLELIRSCTDGTISAETIYRTIFTKHP